jgi:hypothetical protein
MAYTINLTNGTILTTVADGTVNSTSSSLTLIGKNYAGFGDFLNENFVHIVENFADSNAPTTPLIGQLWWDENAAKLWLETTQGWFQRSGSAWQSMAQPEVSLAPAAPNQIAEFDEAEVTKS